jgi:hypothetical protein
MLATRYTHVNLYKRPTISHSPQSNSVIKLDCIVGHKLIMLLCRVVLFGPQRFVAGGARQSNAPRAITDAAVYPLRRGDQTTPQI